MNKSSAWSTRTCRRQSAQGLYCTFPGEKSGIVYQHDFYRRIADGPFQLDLPCDEVGTRRLE